MLRCPERHEEGFLVLSTGEMRGRMVRSGMLGCETMIPLRQKVGRAAVVGPDHLGPEWLAEARRVLLPGRRLVIESERVAPPAGLTQLALGHGLFVGERR